MRKLALALIILTGVGPFAGTSHAASPPITQVFLVQNSGWMEPFYKDPKSHFRDLLGDIVERSARTDTPIIVASFNQDGQVPGRHSPEIRYRGGYDKNRISQAIAAIDLPRKAGGQVYADSDFNGALNGTINGLLGRREAIVWMLTNSKDSPDNASNVIANTQRFYQHLRQSPHITRIAAFPMRSEVSGPNFQEKGFIVYVFAYGAGAGAALEEILRAGSPTLALFRFPPVKLKPLDRDPVEFRLVGSSSPGVTLKDGILTMERPAGKAPITVTLQAELRSTYYPQTIASADVDVDWAGGNKALRDAPIEISPAKIVHVSALDAPRPVSLTLTLPPMDAGSALDLAGDDRVVSDEIQIRLTKIAFGLNRGFVDRISAIGGNRPSGGSDEAALKSQLPSLFLDYRSVTTARTLLPTLIIIRRSPWPLVLVVTSIALFLVMAAALLVWLWRARTYQIPVGGSTMRISIRPFEQRVVSDPFGVRATARGALFGPPRIRTIADDKKMS